MFLYFFDFYVFWFLINSLVEYFYLNNINYIYILLSDSILRKGISVFDNDGIVRALSLMNGGIS